MDFDDRDDRRQYDAGTESQRLGGGSSEEPTYIPRCLGRFRDSVQLLLRHCVLVVWSFAYWDLDWQLCIATMILGVTVILNISVLRGQKADRRSFLLWSFWVMSLLGLPTLKAWQRSEEQGVSDI